jgi:hypothetical protein
MMNQFITVGYNPNDFLYTKATDEVMPSDAQCTDPSSSGYVFVNTDVSCNPFPTPSEDFLNVIHKCYVKVFGSEGPTPPSHQAKKNKQTILHKNPNGQGWNRKEGFTEHFSSPSSNESCNLYSDCQDNEKFMNCLRTEDLSGSTLYYTSTYADDYVKWVQWHDSSFNCYQQELCNNKKLSTEIQKLQNDHLGSDQGLKDSSYLYMDQYIKSINLSIGILLLLGIIFYSK